MNKSTSINSFRIMSSPPTPPRSRKNVEIQTTSNQSPPSAPVSTPLSLQRNTLSASLPNQNLIAENQLSNPRNAKYIYLPNELYLTFFDIMSTSDLLNVRLTNREMKRLVDVILEERMRKAAIELAKRKEDAETKHMETEKLKRPHLTHYRQFLLNISAAELSEVTSYKVPPPEIQTVCECLVILKAGFLPTSAIQQYTSISVPNSPTTNHSFNVTHPSTPISTSSRYSFGNNEDSQQPMSWNVLKKIMSRYEFKSWLVNLRTTVDYISLSNVRKVEKIIMLDPSITYANIRQISMAAYRLLIFCAAILQYVTNSEEVKARMREVATIDRSLTRCKLFLGSISSSGVSTISLIGDKCLDEEQDAQKTKL